MHGPKIEHQSLFFQGGADSAHHFETPVWASFSILPSFETISLMPREIRPRIQKMKYLAQKLTKWRRIEKLWQKHEVERFSKIERFALCKSCYRALTKWLSFRPGWFDFAETGLYGFVITNGKESRSAKAPNFVEFEELQKFQAIADRVKTFAFSGYKGFICFASGVWTIILSSTIFVFLCFSSWCVWRNVMMMLWIRVKKTDFPSSLFSSLSASACICPVGKRIWCKITLQNHFEGGDYLKDGSKY